MNTIASAGKNSERSRRIFLTLMIILGLSAFIFIFVTVDGAYFKFTDAHFPHVGTSTLLANLWGVVSRGYLLLLIIALAIWRPGLFRFHMGNIRKHWKMLLIMLIINCGIIVAYLLLTGSTTPYSGNQWLLTETVTVPLVEELTWRGLVYIALLQAFQTCYSEKTSSVLAIWFSGVAFGLMHANNLIAAVPLQFVAIQVINATVWGVAYGYARAKTDSIYPPILLHAAMNLMVVLF